MPAVPFFLFQDRDENCVREEPSPTENTIFFPRPYIPNPLSASHCIFRPSTPYLPPTMSLSSLGEALPNVSASSAILFGAVVVSSKRLHILLLPAVILLLISARCCQSLCRTGLWRLVTDYSSTLMPSIPAPKLQQSQSCGMPIIGMVTDTAATNAAMVIHKQLTVRCLGSPVVIRGLSRQPSRSMETSSGSRPTRLPSSRRKRRGVISCQNPSPTPQSVPLTHRHRRYPNGRSQGPATFHQNRTTTHPRGTCWYCG